MLESELNTLKSYTSIWWLVVLRGIVGVVLGLLAIAYPLKTVGFLVVVIGLFMVIDSIIAIISSLLSVKKTDRWWVLLVQGIVGLILGLLVFNWPQATVGLILFLVALWAIISGVMLIVSAVSIRKQSYGGWLLTAGAIIAILFGIVMLANPYETVQVVTIIVGLFALVSGIVTTAFGLEIFSMRHDINKLQKELN
jgi:uncharacterized membrane protein HdeD (DUF308 family)